ncbi:hypothetical protein [Alcanivorax sp.]|uniref:tetratricopeptide repeat protein n=1 Tax=Alcanivorax sp. TaxID=1872427 RepID=UPI0026328D43|nr:hypothetical protein [Alcanivorax sp.]
MWVFRLVSVLLVLLVSGCALTSSPPVDYQAVMAEKGAEAAFPALKKAADSGDTKAMMMLADLYQSDWTGETSKSLAMQYYRLASESGVEEAENYYQRLYAAGVRETRILQTPRIDDEAFLFQWSAPEKVKKKRSDITEEHFSVSAGISLLGAQQEKHYFMPWGKTRSGELYRRGGSTGINHTPDSGYSKWVLPNFDVPASEMNGSKHWRKAQYKFTLEPGQQLSEFELPFELRTNLAPNNKISLLLYGTGEVAIKTATSPGKSFLHYESPVVFDGKKPLDIEFWSSLAGDWLLNVNGDLVGSGRVAPEKVINGLSNHFFIEGDVNIHSLTISELGEKEASLSGENLNNEAFSRLESTLIKRFIGDWLQEYLGNSEGWKYSSHERIYLRRSPFDWRRIVHDAVQTGPDPEAPVAPERMQMIYRWLPGMASPRNSYLTSVLVTVRHRNGDVLRFPAQFLLGVVDENANLLSLKLFFNAIDYTGNDYYFGERSDMELGEFRSPFDG